jgi:hypothetical protein
VKRLKGAHALRSLLATVMLLMSAVVITAAMTTPAHADVSAPAWWNGKTCDTNNYPGSYQLGTTDSNGVFHGTAYNGVIACGPGSYNQGGTDHTVYFYSGAQSELEWECVELVMRYMYQVYGIAPYGVPNGGKDVVDNYRGSALTPVPNDGASLPSPGDIVSFGGSTGNPYGHTAVVTGVNVTNGSGSLTIMQQNATANGWGTLTVSGGRITGTILGVTVSKWLHNPNGGSSGGGSGPTFRPAVIQRPSGETDVAVVGPGNTLAFYYNAAGSPAWGGGVIPNSQAYSTPAVVQRPSGETDVVVEGANNSLLFYYNAQGSSSWGEITIPGAVAYSAPAVVQRSTGETDVAVQGANNTLAFYYNAQGSPNWGGGSVPGTEAYSEPAMIQRWSGETDVAVQGSGNSMNFYYNFPGSNSWGTSAVAVPGYVFSAPSIVQRSSGETDIVAQGPANSLVLYINTQGSNAWGNITASGGGTTYSAPNPPVMVLRSGTEIDITAEGPNNQADFYYNAQGSPNWGESTAVGVGNSLRQAAMVQRSTGETDLAVIGPNNRLDFYYNAQGSPSWGSVPIAGDNSAS